MKILEDETQCTGCQACLNACPVNAISVKYNNEGFIYPFVNDAECIHCGKCERICPIIQPVKVNPSLYTYGAYVKNYNNRMISSSGGIFGEMARKVIANGGVVCGAAFDKSLVLRHIIVDNVNDLTKILGTKYVQSDIGMIFQSIEKYLLEDKWVLFSGTSCQVAGLKKYLGKEYEKLISIDLICHGVPSPLVFQQYIKELSRKDRIVEMSFRDKSEGIHNVKLSYKTRSGATIQEDYGKSLYIHGFINNYFIRNSCYQCSFKGIDRCSDITLGDFWGVEQECPNFSDEYGTSAVLIHTDKGNTFFNELENAIDKTKIQISQISDHNICMISSIYKEKTRKYFFIFRKIFGVRMAIYLTSIRVKISKYLKRRN